MKNTLNLLSILVVFFLFGCGGAGISKIIKDYKYSNGDTFSFEIHDQANVSKEGMEIFTTQLAHKFNKLSIEGSPPNKIVEITFTVYSIRSAAARNIGGAMSGRDNIMTEVVIKSKESGKIVGHLQVESGNTSTRSANKFVQQHANKIANYLKTGELSIF